MCSHLSTNPDRKQTLEKPFAGNIAVCGMQIKAKATAFNV